MNEICPICKQSAILEFISYPEGDDLFDVHCQFCGNYKVTRNLTRTSLGDKKPNYLLSAVVRNSFEAGRSVRISSDNINALQDSMRAPSNPIEAIDHLLQYIHSKSDKASSYVPVNSKTDYPIVFASSADDLKYYLQKARELGFIEIGSLGGESRLSLEGWRRIEILKRTVAFSDQAFVAMSFDHSLDLAWTDGFKPALEQTGYKPIRIDLTEHNEKICDKILAELRKSALVVSDFTGQRNGVYFEAGFAMGLSIPVIWTCSEKDFENSHFDTRQYNHIIWNNPNDLKVKLINRIEATMPKN